MDLQQLERIVENGASLKLNEELVPVQEVPTTSSMACVFKDWGTWQLAAHSLWWILTFYKHAEVDKFPLRDSIYGQMSTQCVLWTEVVRAVVKS